MSTIIKLDGVSKRFDSQHLYGSVSLRIESREKVLVCGENGCGKTTLLRIMTGELEPDEGSVYVRPGLTISRLEQSGLRNTEDTVADFVEQIFARITILEQQIRELESGFGSGYSENDAQKYAQLIELFEAAGGYERLKTRDEFLRTFGLHKLLDRIVCTLSGGEQQYLRLAATIFSDAELLILDEPFTFLDAKKTVWLLDYLKTIDKTVIVISHEPALAREFATDVINIRNWEVRKYRGGYDAFRRESAQERARQTQSNTTLDNYIAGREESIAKRREWMKKAENKHQHAVMIRRLERDIKRAERERYAQKKVRGFNIASMVRRRASESGELLVSLRQVSLRYDQAFILDNISLNIYADEHYVILGDNGAGKTTLMKLITKELLPTGGEVVHTRKLAIAAQMQFQPELDGSKTSLELLSTVSSNSRDDWVERYSEYFDADFWEKRLSVLSGGESKRLAIFMCLLHDFDILILDEPTAFVDVQAKSSIIRMINECRKCVIVVTHDPELFENLTGTKLLIEHSNLLFFHDLLFFREKEK